MWYMSECFALVVHNWVLPSGIGSFDVEQGLDTAAFAFLLPRSLHWLAPTISWESLWTSSSVAPSLLANLSSVSMASYSVSLLVVAYCRRMACLMTSPSGDFKITPTPPAFFVDNPSVWIVHLDTCCSSSLGSSSLTVNSTTKLVSDWALIAVRGW